MFWLLAQLRDAVKSFVQAAADSISHHEFILIYEFEGCTSVTPVKSGSSGWVDPGDGSPFLQEKDSACFLSTPNQEGLFSGAERSQCRWGGLAS